MQRWRDLGVDGLTVKFYNDCWDILAQDMLEVLNESLVSCSLPLSCCGAIVTLLPKTNCRISKIGVT